MNLLADSPVLAPKTDRVKGFSINFVRREVLVHRIRRVLILAAVGYLLANVLLMVWLLSTALLVSGQAWQLQAKLHQKLPTAAASKVLYREMETLQEQAVRDLARMNAIVAVQRQRFLVSNKLAALTKTLPDRTWITGLSGRREGSTLTVQASYLIDPGAPQQLPMKKWMAALREDPQFGQGLKRLDVSASSRKRQGRSERFDFELIAEWQPTGRR